MKHIAIVGDGSRHFPGLTTWSRHETDEILKGGMYFGNRSRQTEVSVSYMQFSINPYVKNGRFHPYHLDESNSF